MGTERYIHDLMRRHAASDNGFSPIPPAIRAAVLERDGNICLACGSKGGLVMDHYPSPKSEIKQSDWSKIGPDGLRTLCHRCNCISGTRALSLGAIRARRLEIDDPKAYTQWNARFGHLREMAREELQLALGENPLADFLTEAVAHLAVSEATTKAKRPCAVCGDTLDEGKQRSAIYCSDTCRSKAGYRRSREAVTPKQELERPEPAPPAKKMSYLTLAKSRKVGNSLQGLVHGNAKSDVLQTYLRGRTGCPPRNV